MKKALLAFLLVALLAVSTVSCVPVVNNKQLANIEAQLQTLSSTLASTQQELASTKQALAEAQNKTRLLQLQTQATTSLATSTVATTSIPKIISFTTTPTGITIGQASNLQWNVTGADSVSIYPGIGNVSYAGVRVVYPTTSTTYILTATNSYGSVIAYATTITIPEVYPSPSSPYYLPYPYYAPSYAPPSPPSPPPHHPTPHAHPPTPPRVDAPVYWDSHTIKLTPPQIDPSTGLPKDFGWD